MEEYEDVMQIAMPGILVAFKCLICQMKGKEDVIGIAIPIVLIGFECLIAPAGNLGCDIIGILTVMTIFAYLVCQPEVVKVCQGAPWYSYRPDLHGEGAAVVSCWREHPAVWYEHLLAHIFKHS